MTAECNSANGIDFRLSLKNIMEKFDLNLKQVIASEEVFHIKILPKL